MASSFAKDEYTRWRPTLAGTSCIFSTFGMQHEYEDDYAQMTKNWCGFRTLEPREAARHADLTDSSSADAKRSFTELLYLGKADFGPKTQSQQQRARLSQLVSGAQRAIAENEARNEQLRQRKQSE